MLEKDTSAKNKIVLEHQQSEQEKEKATSSNFFFDKRKYGEYFIENSFPFIDALKKIFILDHLQTNFSAQKQFIEILGNHKLNMDTRLNTYDFETNFPKIISKMLILQKFLNKDVKSFKFLMKISEFKIQRIKLLNRHLTRQKSEITVTLLKHHRDLFQKFKSSFESMEKFDKNIDRVLRLIRAQNSPRTMKESPETIPIKELEGVLINSLEYGFLFASKIFEVNDSVKAFYQFLGMKKVILNKLFKMSFLKGLKFLLSQKDVFEKKSIIFDPENQRLNEIFSYLKDLQKPQFQSIPHFINTVKGVLEELRKISPTKGLDFLGKTYITH
jgi:hypothetical protein